MKEPIFEGETYEEAISITPQTELGKQPPRAADSGVQMIFRLLFSSSMTGVECEWRQLFVFLFLTDNAAASRRKARRRFVIVN